MSKKRVSISLGTFFFLLSGTIFSLLLTVNLVRQVSAKELSQEEAYSQLRVFTDVISLVQRNYVETVDLSELVKGAIRGMLQTLDPHSGYLTPDTYKDLQVETKGQFGGLGIEITVKDGVLTVVAPIEDSPATRAGVRAGDQIIKIEDEFTKDLTLVEAVKKMRGPKGAPITIHVHREPSRALLPLTIVRDVIKVKSVRSRPLDSGFGYIRLAQFQERSADELKAALNSLEKQMGAVKGVVLDLRNNPGGLLTQAVRVGDVFLKEGIIVYTDGRLESQKQKYFAHNEGNEPDFPIVVLVNGGSASASEIVAGAFQDHGRALVLGTQSFGKGSVQTILPMEDGAALRLTTALYYTHSGRSIQAEGVTPDVIVEAKASGDEAEEEAIEELESQEAGPRREKDLPRAIGNPKEKPKAKSGKSSSKKPSEASGKKEPLRPGSQDAMTVDLKELLAEDPQLEEALKLLKTWDIFQKKPTSATLQSASLPEVPVKATK